MFTVTSHRLYTCPFSLEQPIETAIDVGSGAGSGAGAAATAHKQLPLFTIKAKSHNLVILFVTK